MTTVTQRNLWTSTQAYGLFAGCLLVGLVAGYLLHSTAPVGAASPKPEAAAPMTTDQITPEQLKHMADKKAEPFLAQLKDHPKDANLLAQVGATYLAAHQFQTAQEYFKQSLAVKEDPAVLNQSAFVTYSLGDLDGAIATLNRTLKIEPNNRNALFYLGMLDWREKGDPKAAIAAWHRLLKAHPDDPGRAEVEQLIGRAKMHANLPQGTKTDKPAR